MKNTLQQGFVCLLLCSATVLMGQSRPINYQQLAEDNFRLLNKDGFISNQLEFTVHGFKLRSYDEQGAELIKETAFIPWNAASRLVSKLEVTQPYEYSKTYNWSNPLLNDVYNYPASSNYKEIPTSLEGLVVAIDPGHFAGNMQEAIWEDKYVLIHGYELNLKKDVKFYEAELADLTALILENKLLEANAKPFRSKAFGSNAIGKPFKEWYKYDFANDLILATNKGTVSGSSLELLKKHAKDSVYVFQKFFKNLEFRKRIDNINSNVPNLTVSIHYNAYEVNRRDEEGYLKPVQENYSMAFVPGAFLRRELDKTSDKVDFVRLLLSHDLDKSVRLAHLILEQERVIAGISQVPQQNVAIDERYCIPAKYDGVYHRNLAMTRTIHGPVVYLEGLLQDNDREAVNLSIKDYEFTHPVYGKLKAPKRCEQIAEAIYQGIVQWIEENKMIASNTNLQK